MLSRRYAVLYGLIGGAAAGIPTYLIAGDIAVIYEKIDLGFWIGLIIRVCVCGGVGALYGFMAPLPSDRYTGFERGIMAPALIWAAMYTNSPTSGELDKQFSAAPVFQVVASAYAQPQNPPPRQ